MPEESRMGNRRCKNDNGKHERQDPEDDVRSPQPSRQECTHCPQDNISRSQKNKTYSEYATRVKNARPGYATTNNPATNDTSPRIISAARTQLGIFSMETKENIFSFSDPVCT